MVIYFPENTVWDNSHKRNLIHLLFQSRGKANLSDNVPFPLARDKSDCLYDCCLPEVKNK